MQTKLIMICLFVLFAQTFSQTYVPEEITESTTWTAAGNPYILGKQYVTVHSDVNEITLTIEAGVIIQGEYYVAAWPNYNYSRLVIGQNASLVIYGTQGNPVRFTKRPGGLHDAGWGGIIIEENSNASQTSINNVIIDYAGGEVEGMISVYGGSPRLKGIEFNNVGNFYQGTELYFENAENPLVDNCVFKYCRTGIYVEETEPTIRNCYFDTDWSAIELVESFPEMKDNLFADDNYIGLNDLSISGTLDIPGYLESGGVVPYSLNDQHVYLGNSSENIMLTIKPGVVIKGVAYISSFPHESGSRLVVGHNAAVEMIGSKNNPIVFDKDNDNSYHEHNWGGILFRSDADFSNTKIENVKFLHSGNDIEGTVSVYGGTLTVDNCYFENGGIYVDSSASVTVNDCYIGHVHGRAVVVTENSNLEMNNVTVDSCRKSVEVYESSLSMDDSKIISGYEIGNGLYLVGGTVTIDNSVIKDNSSSGIFAREDKLIDVSINNSIITGNPNGILVYLKNGSSFEIHNSQISGNYDYGIHNSSDNVVDATDNWWGDTSGPYDNSDDSNDPTGLYNPVGLGDRVTDYVDYGGWLTFMETESPNILCLKDVPNDQGRFIHICWSASSLDSYESQNPIFKYSVWRKVEDDICPTTNLQSFDMMTKSVYNKISSEGWDFISDVTAVPEFEKYYYVAPTLGDSTDEGIVYSTFMIIAHTNVPSVYFKSEPVSGYSIDNLVPSVPQVLEGIPDEQGLFVTLSWKPNPEADVDYYSIYLSNDNNLLLGTTTDTVFVHENVIESNYVYRISATDFNGNESDLSDPINVVVGINEEGQCPQSYALFQNYPNPFNPSTMVKYQIPEKGFVRLSVFNVLGKEVVQLINKIQTAGKYSVEFDASELSSGIYFYRISAGSFVQTKKMILIK